eukprot:GEMP01041910.1.p1 GENE.GEMP01041910.1~~GEMP01041910.1.p1  ORF type:complete len:468 (+),score=93.45 GEMP01041910.1:111-1406(+)
MQKENIDPITEDPDTCCPNESHGIAERPNLCASPLRQRNNNKGVASTRDGHIHAKKGVAFSIDNQENDNNGIAFTRDNQHKDTGGVASTSDNNGGACTRDDQQNDTEEFPSTSDNNGGVPRRDLREKLPKQCRRAQKGEHTLQKPSARPQAPASPREDKKEGGAAHNGAMRYVSTRISTIIALSLIGILTVPRWIAAPGTHSIFGFAFLDDVFFAPTTAENNEMEPRRALSEEGWRTVATVAAVESKTVIAEDARKRRFSEPQGTIREKGWSTATSVTVREPSTVVTEHARARPLGGLGFGGLEQDTRSDKIQAPPRIDASTTGECQDLISSQHRRMQELENDNKMQAEAYQQMLKSMMQWVDYTRKEQNLNLDQSLKQCMDTGLTTASLMQMQFDAMSAEVRARRKQLTDEIHVLSLKVLALESVVHIDN